MKYLLGNCRTKCAAKTVSSSSSSEWTFWLAERIKINKPQSATREKAPKIQSEVLRPSEINYSPTHKHTPTHTPTRIPNGT